MSLKNMLINHFLHSLKNQSINESITVLALIGIEQVMQDQSVSNQKESFLNEIQMIKNQIKVLNESMNLDQTQINSLNKIKTPPPIIQESIDKFPQKQVKSIDQTKSFIRERQSHNFDRPQKQNKKQRRLTPKITEINPATIQEVQTIKPRVSRHHLDDQAMKEALTQQYDDWDESAIQTPYEKPKTPQLMVKQLIPEKKQKSNSPKPKQIKPKQAPVFKKPPTAVMNKEKAAQSLNYFIPVNEDHFNRQQMMHDLGQFPPPNRIQCEQEQYLVQSQCHSQSRRSNDQVQIYQSQPSSQQQRSARQQMSQRSKTDFHEMENEQIYYDQMTQELLEKYQQQLQLPPTESLQEDQIKQYIRRQDLLQASDTFSFQPPNRITGGTSNFSLQTEWNEDFSRNKKSIQNVTSPNFENKQSHQQPQQYKHSLLEIATDLLNSPIIRQISMKNSSSDEKVAVVHKVKSNDSVQVSGFDVQHQIQTGDHNSTLSSNSSAFSLFKPNEELRSFFQNEFIYNFNPQNQSQVYLRNT